MIRSRFNPKHSPCFLFNRVSTKMHEQETSLEQQERDSFAYAKRNNLHVAYNFRVQETASKEEERHVFNQMITLLKSELINVKHVVFKSADRSSRNRFDKDQLDKLRKHHGVTIHYYSSGKILHGQSHYTDELQDDIENLFATHFARELSHKIRSAYEYKVFEKKQAPCRTVPYGYRWDKNDKQHYIDREAEPVVRSLFEEYDAGAYSLSAFVDYCNKNNLLPASGIPWTKGRMEKFLKNPFYCGWFRYKGGVYEGIHQPYFSKEQYDARLARLAANRNGRSGGRRRHLLSKFLRCSKCGRAYVAEEQTGAHDSGRYVYYKHRCGGRRKERRIREDAILTLAGEAVQSLYMEKQFAGRLADLFREPLKKRERHNRKEIRFLTGQIEEWRGRKAKLLDLFTEDGIEKEELLARRDEYERRIGGLNARLKSLTQDNDRVFERIVEAVELIRALPGEFLKAGSPEKQIEALKTMADGLLLTPGGDMEIDWKAPFGYLMRPEMCQAIEQEDREILRRPAEKGRERGRSGIGFNPVSSYAQERT